MVLLKLEQSTGRMSFGQFQSVGLMSYFFSNSGELFTGWEKQQGRHAPVSGGTLFTLHLLLIITSTVPCCKICPPPTQPLRSTFLRAFISLLLASIFQTKCATVYFQLVAKKQVSNVALERERERGQLVVHAIIISPVFIQQSSKRRYNLVMEIIYHFPSTHTLTVTKNWQGHTLHPATQIKEPSIEPRKQLVVGGLNPLQFLKR